MKIQGHPVSTEIELTDGFRTGIVRAKYYDPDSTYVNGAEIDITVIGCSSAYKVTEQTSEHVIVIKHSKVTVCTQNDSP